MKLRDKFKTNTTAANDGVWFDFTEYPNEDTVYEEDGVTVKTPATVPGFKVARKSSHNAEYAKAMRDVTTEVNTPDGVKQYSDLTEEEAEAVELDVFIKTLLVEWRNFQPEDDGVDLPYTEENARAIFGNPDWRDLRATLSIRAGQSANYAYKKREAEVKN